MQYQRDIVSRRSIILRSLRAGAYITPAIVGMTQVSEAAAATPPPLIPGFPLITATPVSGTLACNGTLPPAFTVRVQRLGGQAGLPANTQIDVFIFPQAAGFSGIGPTVVIGTFTTDSKATVIYDFTATLTTTVPDRPVWYTVGYTRHGDSPSNYINEETVQPRTNAINPDCPSQ